MASILQAVQDAIHTEFEIIRESLKSGLSEDLNKFLNKSTSKNAKKLIPKALKTEMLGSGLFKSSVENYIPATPIKFTKSGDKSNDPGTKVTTLPELIKNAAPEFYKGYSFFVNPMLSSGHAQTAYTALNKFANSFHVHYKRRILTIEDKTYTLPTGERLKYDQWEGETTIALDYAVPHHDPNPDHEKFKPASQTKELPPRTEYMNPQEEPTMISNDDSKPLLIVLHGLSGGSYEAYIRAVLNKIILDPYHVDAVVLNSRGCFETANKRVYLMGFSLGGAILANYLGQEGDAISKQIKGAFIFGTPWDFPDSAVHLRESIIGHNVYSPTMCNNLMRLLDSHGILLNNEYIKQCRDNADKYNIKFLKQFDHYFTSKLFGLNSADEYYRLASPVQRLMKVRVPTVIISSKDDPITGSRTLPISEVELNPYTTLVTTTVGGHLGWFTLTGDRWYTTPICKLITEMNKWDVDHSSVTKDDLPVDINKSWRHDRLVNGIEHLLLLSWTLINLFIYTVNIFKMHNTNSNNSNNSTAAKKKQTSKKQIQNSSNGNSSCKWISQLRTLPSNPNSNDFLKLEYIDVNLNNSRKLISNVIELSESTKDYIDDVDLQINGNLIQLTQVKRELQWLDKL
ncbi:uncharacterized protein J8A68_005012 [[Candida] subhashii]|uniref:AB hydrolase-1 domain-containing protein n=1 Tax=[Candida] subhashii TaxID=561895 RepID=A0A8J5QG51_9ASCO|nr:uncharacterized protein J8A68_005012 [[Candida] subhashii]KAG7661434.1 hypothetical protein J8A68_005012 [[Candida] subhashii]